MTEEGAHEPDLCPGLDRAEADLSQSLCVNGWMVGRAGEGQVGSWSWWGWGSGCSNLCYLQNSGAALFFCVPELVGTFRWHCYPACFLRTVAFVSLTPIVGTSFVPWLQQWLFFCLLIYMCTFCPCEFCLFCSAVCSVFLSSCCRAANQPILSLSGAPSLPPPVLSVPLFLHLSSLFLSFSPFIYSLGQI